MLIAYKSGWIRVNRRFYGFVMAAAIGFVLLMVVNLLFVVFGGGDGLGFRSGGLGILFGVIGIVLGACFLALDFKQVEDGIAYGAPREESWLAAFGLTLTLVWIYLEMLRLIAILQRQRLAAARGAGRPTGRPRARRPRALPLLRALRRRETGSEQFARGPPQVVLVDDRFGVAVREVVLAAEPADLLLEAEEGGAFVDGAEPVGDFTTGAMGDAGEHVAVGLFGEDLGHRRLRTHGVCWSFKSPCLSVRPLATVPGGRVGSRRA